MQKFTARRAMQTSSQHCRTETSFSRRCGLKIGLGGDNYARVGTKATSTCFVALYHWAQRHRPERLADEDQWDICNCCKDLLA